MPRLRLHGITQSFRWHWPLARNRGFRSVDELYASLGMPNQNAAHDTSCVRIVKNWNELPTSRGIVEMALTFLKHRHSLAQKLFRGTPGAQSRRHINSPDIFEFTNFRACSIASLDSSSNIGGSRATRKCLMVRVCAPFESAHTHYPLSRQTQLSDANLIDGRRQL